MADLEEKILKSLRTLSSADRPATFNALARQFGATAPLISSVAHGMVDKGIAQPYYVNIAGVDTMYGLLPQPQPVAS
jgi:hypothetical protein